LIAGSLIMLAGGAALAIGQLAGLFPAWIGLIIMGIGYIPIGYTQFIMGQWMAHGDTCPAVVLDPSSLLVAVWADMTTDPSRQSHPAIRILSLPIKKATGCSLQAGSKLPVVCVYEGPMEAEKWENVKPVPVGCATQKQEVVSQKLQSIPVNEWTALEQGLATLPKPYKPGLYFLQSTNSNW
ncbi:MAG: DUF3239 domain-containing protein, partial [Planctomycetota bacterium]